MKVGIIEDIDIDKFQCGGNIYVIKNLTENSKINNINNIILNTKFDSKIMKIIERVNDEGINKTLDKRNKEIEDFLEEKNTDILDIIFFTDTGIRGIEKVVLAESSIFYLELTPNIKLGFFVNKLIGKAIKGGIYGDKTK